MIARAYIVPTVERVQFSRPVFGRVSGERRSVLPQGIPTGEISEFEGYEWKIENCDEVGINNLSETLKNEIIEVICQEEDL